MGRAEILRAAQDLFSTQPYEAVSLARIAAAVGIKTPSLYAHFDSKQAIFRAVCDQVVDEHTAYFTALLTEGEGLTPPQRLHHVLASIQTYYAGHPELVGFHLRAAVDASDAGRPTIQEAIRRSDAELLGFLRTAYHDGRSGGWFTTVDADEFAALFACVMDGLFLQLAYYPASEHGRLFEQAWAGLQALLLTDRGDHDAGND